MNQFYIYILANKRNGTLYVGITTEVRLEFYNILGQIVQEWQLGSLGVGEHAVEWDGSNSAGLIVSSGVYFYRLYVEAHALSRKMTLVK